MSEGNTKTALGARVLTENEIRLILPTYDKMKEQIQWIRESIINREPLDMQATNNIGILGNRGSGKTSVLKTLIRYLENDNKQNNSNHNIIMPMIVPENMSESTNIMGNILGLFKREVEKIEEEYRKEKKECWEKTEVPCVIRSYYKLLKKYCYIQKEFREVNINQYTTDNDYIRKSSEIYEADIEFLNDFNCFVSKFIEAKNNKKEDKALIFLFIDDIDLSTQRCTDVVKTLLSYLSHPRIVTFISGDLDTFDEALTIDFLRQEQALDGGLLERDFLKGKKLLNRRRRLSYEYLKKVLPPLYRHYVKNWSLSERGNYTVQIEEDDHDNRKKTLSELFDELFQLMGCNYPVILKYYDYIKNKELPIPQSCYIFDNTSRGLNNVYNVLLETVELYRSGSDAKIRFVQIKLLIETIVFSNPNLNKYRVFIFENLIRFGMDFKSTEIICSNFKNGDYYCREDIEDKENKKNKILTTFRIFVLMDLAIRLLEKHSILKEKLYDEIKKDILLLLINHPLISERLDIINPLITEAKVNKNIILKIFMDLDFYRALVCYQYLIDKGYDVWGNLKNKDLKYIRIIYIYYTVRSIAKSKRKSKTNERMEKKEIQKLISEFIITSRKRFLILFDTLSNENMVNLIKNVVGITFDIRGEDSFRYILSPVDPIESLYYNYLIDLLKKEDVVKNDSLVGLTAENKEKYSAFLKEKCKDIREDRNNRGVEDENGQEIVYEVDRERLDWIYAINSNFELVDSEFIETIRNYTQKRLTKLLKKVVDYLQNGEDWENRKIRLDTEFEFAYNELQRNYKETSDVTLEKLYDVIENKSVFESSKENKFRLINESVNANDYQEMYIICRRLFFKRIWNGKRKTLALLRALQKSRFVCTELSDTIGEDEKELSMWLHFYIIYNLNGKDRDDFYKIAEEMSDFAKYIEEGFVIENGKSVENYGDISMEEELNDEVINRIRELFYIPENEV